ncbi:hypothetical protein H0H93_008500 [Arthromyces matolae]|nr:hypothetical protein H0H93_008500 [Arthromyces matolae]
MARRNISYHDEIDEMGLFYAYDVEDDEIQDEIVILIQSQKPKHKLELLLAFMAGFIAYGLIQLYFIDGLPFENCRCNCIGAGGERQILAPPYAGSSVAHDYPPTRPTNAIPTLFPSDIGYMGKTTTGAEPAVIVTAPSYPIQTGAALVRPHKLKSKQTHAKGSLEFDIFKTWGTLSPWYSVDRGAFGLDSHPTAPDTCRITGLHLLHRHGARYPSPLGRTYLFLFCLAISHEGSQAGPAKFAQRLNNATAKWNATESLKFLNTWDRMLQSAINFALGCPNALNSRKAGRGEYYVSRWSKIYLQKALHRLQPHLDGYELSIQDLYSMQEMCVYERIHARLTHTKILQHNPATNATLDDDPTTFPLNHTLYVDATHEELILNVITGLNLTKLAASKPLPYTHIPHHRAFKTSELAPFASNLQFQLLQCTSMPGPQIRIIINDGVVPLTGIRGCPEQCDGMCPLGKFVEAQMELLAETDWDWACLGGWEVPEGPEWNTTMGNPPQSELSANKHIRLRRTKMYSDDDLIDKRGAILKTCKGMPFIRVGEEEEEHCRRLFAMSFLSKPIEEREEPDPSEINFAIEMLRECRVSGFFETIQGIYKRLTDMLPVWNAYVAEFLALSVHVRCSTTKVKGSGRVYTKSDFRFKDRAIWKRFKTKWKIPVSVAYDFLFDQTKLTLRIISETSGVPVIQKLCLLDLPTEVLSKILSHASASKVARLSTTCKRLYDIGKLHSAPISRNIFLKWPRTFYQDLRASGLPSEEYVEISALDARSEALTVCDSIINSPSLLDRLESLAIINQWGDLPNVIEDDTLAELDGGQFYVPFHLSPIHFNTFVDWIRQSFHDIETRLSHLKIESGEDGILDSDLVALLQAFGTAPLEVLVIDGALQVKILLIDWLARQYPDLLGLTILRRASTRSTRTSSCIWTVPIWQYAQCLSSFRRLQFFEWNNTSIFEIQYSTYSLPLLEDGGLADDDDHRLWDAQHNELLSTEDQWSPRLFGICCPTLQTLVVAFMLYHIRRPFDGVIEVESEDSHIGANEWNTSLTGRWVGSIKASRSAKTTFKDYVPPASHLLSLTLTTMAGKSDVETGEAYSHDSCDDYERESLLPSASGAPLSPGNNKRSFEPKRQFGVLPLCLAFVAGILACAGTQLVVCGPGCFVPGNAQSHPSTGAAKNVHILAPPYVGSTEVHNFPPASPTNANPTLFPSDVGYPGATPTGAEPGVIITAPAYPIHTGAAQLVAPNTLGNANSGKGKNGDFDIFKKWGNLSPWYSVGRGAFGLDSEPTVPETCRVTGLHFLHRHGARYPTEWASFGGPAKLAARLNEAAAEWNATDDLEFLNDWDRMLYSALNFAIGFFGYPLDGKYEQSITIEAPGFNNTLAPYDTCPNSRIFSKAERGLWYVKEWTSIYLKDALGRLQSNLKGYELSIEDVYIMQQMCAYETVAIGYSKFCELFTEEEWEGFNYALDLSFWYGSAFGSPVARVQGYGWIKELVARLTHTPIAEHNSSTNSTLDDNPTTFPLNQSLYVDATHEVVVLNIITALNLTNFATTGPLPWTHIPKNRSFEVSKLAPFATNVQFQCKYYSNSSSSSNNMNESTVLECTSVPGPQIRIIINDGVTPLTGINGCPEQQDGMCPVDTFVKAQKELLLETDWKYDCYGDWTVPEGPAWNTTRGSPPAPRHL